MLELQQRKKAPDAGIFEAGGSAATVLEAANIERRREAPPGVELRLHDCGVIKFSN